MCAKVKSRWRNRRVIGRWGSLHDLLRPRGASKQPAGSLSLAGRLYEAESSAAPNVQVLVDCSTSAFTPDIKSRV